MVSLIDLDEFQQKITVKKSNTTNLSAITKNASPSSTFLKTEANADVLDAFDDLIRKFKRNGVTPAQLEMAKRSIAMQYLAQMKSNLSLAEDFATSELIYGDWKASLNWFSEMMKVKESFE